MLKLKKSDKIGVILGGVVFIGLISYALAWNAPAGSPTGNNAAAPLNTSSAAQTKAGNLTVSGDLNGTRLCIAGNCKSAWPTSNCQKIGYGVREDGASTWCSYQLIGLQDGAGNFVFGTTPSSGYLVCCSYVF